MAKAMNEFIPILEGCHLSLELLYFPFKLFNSVVLFLDLPVTGSNIRIPRIIIRKVGDLRVTTSGIHLQDLIQYMYLVLGHYFCHYLHAVRDCDGVFTLPCSSLVLLINRKQDYYRSMALYVPEIIAFDLYG